MNSEEVSAIYNRARLAQKQWSKLSSKEKDQCFSKLQERLLNQVDHYASVISKENGKPLFEALSNDLFPSVDFLSQMRKKAPKFLKRKNLPLRLMIYKKSTLEHEPLGVVLIISPWNFPFSIPFTEVIMGLVTGNAVILKPSEVTPKSAECIFGAIQNSGFPDGLFQLVQGDGQTGASLISGKPEKIFFTGSAETGKKIMSQASQTLTPVCLELGGKDALIVFPDSNLDLATSAALWGSLFNAGQACSSIERIFIHEEIKSDFFDLLRKKAEKLIVQKNPSSGDAYEIGPATLPKQVSIYKKHIEDAKEKGCQFFFDPVFYENERTVTQPNFIYGKNIRSCLVYQEETFGPLAAVESFKSEEEVIRLVNESKYGLNASVFTKNQEKADRIAKALQVGTVMVNEVAYTHGLGETPWGGVKESGFGRTHSVEGLREFTNLKHIHSPRLMDLEFKSFWWFPYTEKQKTLFLSLFGVYRKNIFKKITSVFLLLWNFVIYVKHDKRL